MYLIRTLKFNPVYMNPKLPLSSIQGKKTPLVKQLSGLIKNKILGKKGWKKVKIEYLKTKFGL